jgi:hypothetical protein
MKWKLIILWFRLNIIDLTLYRLPRHLKCKKDPLHLKISPFVNFMFQILFHRSNSVQIVTLFKILNDMTVYTMLDL